MDECKPLPMAARNFSNAWLLFASASGQGLTLIHLAAQRKCFLWDRRCIHWWPMGRLGGVGGYLGVFRVYFVSETDQVELKSGRV